MPLITLAPTLFLAAILGLLAGCGQKGPLTLPKAAVSAAPPSSPAPASASSPASAP